MGVLAVLLGVLAVLFLAERHPVVDGRIRLGTGAGLGVEPLSTP